MTTIIRIEEVIIVEGRYDAAKLTNIVDGFIITTDGFDIFSNEEKKELIKTLGKKRGLIVLTDSDAAGFRIRNYINNIATGIPVKNVYIPSVQGKESRKALPSKEGTLGVEGIDSAVLERLLLECGSTPKAAKTGRVITYADLYELGISGTAGSAEKRREFLTRIGLPHRLSKKALLETLNSLYTYEELLAVHTQKPPLFWDFHGTLVKPDIIWFDAAEEAISTYFPNSGVTRATIEKNFSQQCLPWWYFEDRDTRHLIENDGWWRFCQEQFTKMFTACGFTQPQAEKMAPHIRTYVIKSQHHILFDDAKEVLATLQKRGYRHYMVSNNFPELRQIATEMGLDTYFSGYVISAQVGYDKPRAEIFEQALKMAGGTTAIMIGDNPYDDIEGAKKAGLYAIGVNEGACAPLADAHAQTLTELLDILK